MDDDDTADELADELADEFFVVVKKVAVAATAAAPNSNVERDEDEVDDDDDDDDVAVAVAVVATTNECRFDRCANNIDDVIGIHVECLCHNRGFVILLLLMLLLPLLLLLLRTNVVVSINHDESLLVQEVDIMVDCFGMVVCRSDGGGS
jgi:hypothetical protein